MTGKELAVLLGHMVGMAGRARLRKIAMGKGTEVALRYDEVKDWSGLNKLIEDDGVVELFDGEEWFVLQLGAT